MRNAMILKARIKKLAAEKNIPPQAMLQSVMFERFLKLRKCLLPAFH